MQLHIDVQDANESDYTIMWAVLKADGFMLNAIWRKRQGTSWKHTQSK